MSIEKLSDSLLYLITSHPSSPVGAEWKEICYISESIQNKPKPLED
jgi:hypothetical protein